MGLWTPYYSNLRVLIALVLCRSYFGNPSCRESRNAAVLSCPGYVVSLCSFLTSGSDDSFILSSKMIPEGQSAENRCQQNVKTYFRLSKLNLPDFPSDRFFFAKPLNIDCKEITYRWRCRHEGGNGWVRGKVRTELRIPGSQWCMSTLLLLISWDFREKQLV